jgi:uncharacterized protein (TIGR02118 family)
MAILRVCYRHGVRFDEQYYVTKHLPLVGGIMGPFGVTGVEMMKVTASGDGAAPRYQVIFTAYFETMAALQKALAGPRMSEVMGDVPNYYDGAPEIFVGDAVALPAPA